jgi:predicted DCC family thiol-disulfide oxidoreductase YuxK
VADVTVYYDASCPLCRREISLYRGRSEASFVDVSDPGNAPPDLSPEEAMARFHVRENGRLLSGAAAFAALWRVTRGFRLAGRIAGLPGIRHVLEAGYRAFLLVRPAVQRGVRRATCESETCR